MNGVIRSVMIMGFFVLFLTLFFIKDVFPDKPLGVDRKVYESRLEKERKSSAFLQLDDSFLKRFSQENISSLEGVTEISQEEKGKINLF